MLSAVNLDNQHVLDTRKVCIERPHRMLAAEFIAVKALCLYFMPKCQFRICLVLAEGTGFYR